MFSRRQRTKQLTNLIFKRNDELIEIFETQFEVRILIRSIFESRFFLLQLTTNVQNFVFLTENVNMIDALIKD